MALKDWSQQEQDDFYCGLAQIRSTDKEAVLRAWFEHLFALEVEVFYQNSEGEITAFIIVRQDKCLIFSIETGAMTGNNSNRFKALARRIIKAHQYKGQKT